MQGYRTRVKTLLFYYGYMHEFTGRFHLQFVP